MTTPRGIRNNNPGNIRRSKIKWLGKVESGTDDAFEQFVSPEMGIRAIARDLMSGYKRGHDTVREIVTEWAPPVENNTRVYIAAVCKALNAAPDTVIDVDRYAIMAPMVKAIIQHENGQQPYSENTIRAALLSAGVSDTPAAPPNKTPEAVGAKMAGGGGGGVALIETAYDALEKIEPLKATLETLAPSLTIAKYLLLAITLAGAALVGYGLLKKFRGRLA